LKHVEISKIGTRYTIVQLVSKTKPKRRWLRDLFLVGENEVIYSITGAEAVARLNRVAPEIETELFPDCGHDITLVRADRFNRRVLEFINRQD